MACAHDFGQWCSECISTMVQEYNRAHADAARYRKALMYVRLNELISDKGVDVIDAALGFAADDTKGE